MGHGDHVGGCRMSNTAQTYPDLINDCLLELHTRSIRAWACNKNARRGALPSVIAVLPRVLRRHPISGISHVDTGVFLALDCVREPENLRTDHHMLRECVTNVGGIFLEVTGAEDMVAKLK